MAILLMAAGDVVELSPANGIAFDLRELQALVGGYIEVVSTVDGRWLVLNEDGKRLQLPANARATEILRAAGGVPGDVVVGDVLLADSVEMGEEEHVLLNQRPTPLRMDPRRGFDWLRVTWYWEPTAQLEETCSYCGAAIEPDAAYIPLRVWRESGGAAVFCEDCMVAWFGFSRRDPDPETFP